MLMNSNEKIEDVMKIVKSLEDFDLLIKGITKTFEKKKIKRSGFLGMLLSTLDDSVFKKICWQVLFDLVKEQLKQRKISNSDLSSD